MILEEIALVSKLSDRLELLGDGSIDPISVDKGVCNDINVYIYSNTLSISVISSVKKSVKDLMYEYANLDSDCIAPYIVPHPIMTESYAYHQCENKWANDEYGANRRRFCTWLSYSLRKTYNLH